MKGKGELYRIPQRGRIAGVCAGVSERFGIEVWLVRILMISGLLLSGTLFFVAYIAAWFILDKHPHYTGGAAKQSKNQATQDNGQQQTTHASQFSKGKQQLSSSTSDLSPIDVKQKVWQAGEPPAKAFHDITSQFQQLEVRLQKVETFVTSTEFTISREIAQL